MSWEQSWTKRSQYYSQLPRSYAQGKDEGCMCGWALEVALTTFVRHILWGCARTCPATDVNKGNLRATLTLAMSTLQR